MTEANEVENLPTRCGFIALVGAPNAGKSTLLNALVGTKVSIVTHKAQTTRAQIRGVVTEGVAQIVFIDTPGIFAPKRRLDRAMVSAAWEGAEAADAVLLMVDPIKQRRHELEPLLEALSVRPERKVLVLNKVDAAKKEPLLALAGGADGMDFVRTLLAEAPAVMAPSSVLVLEIGNERPYFEAAFPKLEVVWLETSAGSDQVLLITREALLTHQP